INQEQTDTAHSKEWAVLVESWQKFRTNRSRNKCDHYSGWRKRDRYWNNDHRPPTRNATQKKEFQRLIAELKRLASKKGYSQEQMASEIGVTTMTVNHWWTGYSLTAKQRKYRAAEKVFGCSISRLSVRGT